MTPTLAILIAVLVVWMLALGWCGYAKRFLLVLPVLLVGLGLNWAWMVFGLGAKRFETPVLMAQMSAVLYAICALATGWLIGRFVRQWHDSRVEKGPHV
jgi:hypothetical protein